MGYPPQGAGAAAGITKLSELEIDADKAWNAKEITQLKAIAEAMAKGDMVARGSDVMVKLTPGPISYVLTSQGAGKIASWHPPGGELKRYLPATIELTFDKAIVSVDKSHNKNVPLASEHKQAHEDAPADYIKRLTPAVASTHDEAAGITPDKTHNENAPVTRKYDLEIVVGGAVADDGGVQTDETAAAQNPTANDMTLLPAVPAVNDAYYFGYSKKFNVMILNIGTQGVGSWTIVWEYWNGTAWSALVDLTDGTTGFTAATGKKEVSHTPQGDWVLTTIQAMELYWIRARVSAYTSITTQPLGTQSWIRIIT